jgi:hypothetical protein
LIIHNQDENKGEKKSRIQPEEQKVKGRNDAM